MLEDVSPFLSTSLINNISHSNSFLLYSLFIYDEPAISTLEMRTSLIFVLDDESTRKRTLNDSASAA